MGRRIPECDIPQRALVAFVSSCLPSSLASPVAGAMVVGALPCLALRPPPAAGMHPRGPRIPLAVDYAARHAVRSPLRIPPPPLFRGASRRISIVAGATGGSYKVPIGLVIGTLRFLSGIVVRVAYISSQVGGGGDELAGNSKGGGLSSWARPFLNFVSSNFLPLGEILGRLVSSRLVSKEQAQSHYDF